MDCECDALISSPKRYAGDKSQKFRGLCFSRLNARVELYSFAYKTRRKAAERRLSYRIRQYYLPPDSDTRVRP